MELAQNVIQRKTMPDNNIEQKEYILNEVKIACELCGAPDSRYGEIHHNTCPRHWHGRHTPVILLRLNAYQASNLLVLLKKIVNGTIPNANTGDWNGEIPYQLQVLMEQAGGAFKTHTANTGENPIEYK